LLLLLLITFGIIFILQSKINVIVSNNMVPYYIGTLKCLCTYQSL
jgi:hypothetical protein